MTGPQEDQAGAWRRVLERRAWRSIPLGLVVAVLVPTLLFGWVSLRVPPEFDGAMNLQVAQSLAEDGSYARSYEFVPRAGGDALTVEWEREHPSEVQTNGPFQFAAAVGFALFGTGRAAMGFGNVVFVAVLAGAIWLLLRPWPWLAVAAPLVTLSLLPNRFKVGLRGLGELPALAFVVLGLALIVSAVRTPDDRLALAKVSGGLVAAGLAVVTKTYMLGAAPAFVVALAAFVWLRRDLLRRVLVRLPLALAAPVAFEAYRLWNLGPGRYRDWWDQQLTAVGYQAGANPTQSGRFDRERTGLVTRARNQFVEFADLVKVPNWALVVVLVVVGLAALAAAWWWLACRSPGTADDEAGPGATEGDPERRDAALERPGVSARVASGDRAAGPDRVAQGGAVALVGLATLAASYMAWWLVLVPERKAFLRRTYPAWLAAVLALLVAGCLAHRWWAARRAEQGRPPPRPVAVVALALVPILLALGYFDVFRSTRGWLRSDTSEIEGIEEAADSLADLAPDHDLYGIGFFWSAPVLSLLSEAELHNLVYIDPCDVDPDRALLVWDAIALQRSGPEPDRLLDRFEYGPPIRLGPEAQAHPVRPLPEACTA